MRSLFLVMSTLVLAACESSSFAPAPPVAALNDLYATLDVQPKGITLARNGTQQLTVMPLTATGEPVSGPIAATYTSADTNRITVSATGVITGKAVTSPALRPVRYGRWGETTPGATQMDWYNKQGLSMSLEDWDSPAERTLQYLAASTPEFEEFNRILLVVHGLETTVTVTLPEHEGVAGYTLLWDSAHDDLSGAELEHGPGEELEVGPTSMLLFQAH